jgi:hypothetical protein
MTDGLDADPVDREAAIVGATLHIGDTQTVRMVHR